MTAMTGDGETRRGATRREARGGDDAKARMGEQEVAASLLSASPRHSSPRPRIIAPSPLPASPRHSSPRRAAPRPSLINLQHREERLLRNLDSTHALHPFFSFLLLL